MSAQDERRCSVCGEGWGERHPVCGQAVMKLEGELRAAVERCARIDKGIAESTLQELLEESDRHLARADKAEDALAQEKQRNWARRGAGGTGLDGGRPRQASAASGRAQPSPRHRRRPHAMNLTPTQAIEFTRALIASLVDTHDTLDSLDRVFYKAWLLDLPDDIILGVARGEPLPDWTGPTEPPVL